MMLLLLLLVMATCICLYLQTHPQGGLTWLWLDAPYVITARKLFNWAVQENDKGNPFPVSAANCGCVHKCCRFKRREIAAPGANNPMCS
jgi:hypothetical protein